MDEPAWNNPEAVEAFLNKGLSLEGTIETAGKSVREKAKSSYKQELLDARLFLTAIFAHFQEFKSGVPGTTNDSITHRLTLLAVFVQGMTFTERLISEGQYVKATGVLKQDYELLTPVREVIAGQAKPGITPNVRHAPRGSQRFYGQLNDLAHPSNLDSLQAVLGQMHGRDVHGLTVIPSFKEVARDLYELHVWLMFQMAREAYRLAIEMYGPSDSGIALVLKWLWATSNKPEEAGFESSSRDEPE